MAITSKDINLVQLDKELGSKGLIADFNDPENKVILPADDSDISEKELEAAIVAHKSVSIKDDKTDILNRLGLTEDELKTILG